MIIELNMCNKCNGYCSYCPYEDVDNYKQMSEEVFNSVIELCNCHAIDRINIGGFSEPTYHTNIISMIDTLILNNIRVDLSTNVTHVSKLIGLINKDMEFSLHKLKGESSAYYSSFNMIVDMLETKERIYHTNDFRTMNKLSRCGLEPSLKDGCLEVVTGHSYIDDRITIDYDGEVLLCCYDWGKMSFGNILKNNLSEISNNKYEYLMNMRNRVDCDATGFPCFRCEHGVAR